MTRRKDSKTAHKIAVFIKKNRIKKYGDWGGISAAAKEFGTHNANWSQWESGKATPNDPTQRKLAKFFGVSLAELRGDHEKPPAEAGEDIEDANRQMEAREALHKSVSRLLASLGVILESTEPAGHLTPVAALESLLDTLALASKSLEEALEPVRAPDAAPPSPASTGTAGDL